MSSNWSKGATNFSFKAICCKLYLTLSSCSNTVPARLCRWFYYIFLWYTYMKYYEIIWNIIFILLFMQFYKNAWFMACTLTNMDRNHYNIMVFGCLEWIIEVMQFTTTEEIEIFHFRWGINAYLLPIQICFIRIYM